MPSNGLDVRVGRVVLASVLPPRPWPLELFTFAAPLCVGLAIHALIQIDRAMLTAAFGVGALALLVGGLPATVTHLQREGFVPADHQHGHLLIPGIGGDRRWFALFLVLSLVAIGGWWSGPVRVAAGVPAVAAGLFYLISQASAGRRVWAMRPGAARGITAVLIPLCYVIGPASAVAIAALAMRPHHLGEWRDVVYTGMGRVAAGVAIVYWLLFERALHTRFRALGARIPDSFLPPRILAVLVAATGFLVPGGGTPYAVSWALSWLVVAYYERKLSMS